jgi:hypothetical protein
MEFEPMKRRVGAVVIAATLVAPSMTWAAAEAPTGRWYKECGEAVYCRVYVEKAGVGRFKFHFMTTSPNSDRSCEWISILERRDDGKLASTGKGAGFEAWVDIAGTLRTVGTMPSQCGARPAADEFKPDDADENGDL